MLKNRRALNPRKCWCGKPKPEWDSKYYQVYCCEAHRKEWWERTDYVGPHKDKFLSKHKICANCGKEKGHDYFSRLEMDHIIAIALGGHPWDERNLQALCSNCHKKKTTIDVKIIAWWKRESNYDNTFELHDDIPSIEEWMS